MPSNGVKALDVAKSSIASGYVTTTTTLQAVYIAQLAVTAGMLYGNVSVSTAIAIFSYMPAAIIAAPVVGATAPLLYYSAKWALSSNSKDEKNTKAKQQSDSKSPKYSEDLLDDEIVVISEATTKNISMDNSGS